MASGGQEGHRGQDASGGDGSTGRQQGPLPAISLPKGGGAIGGIGEKFAANPVTGTASLTIPIAASPGRSGFGPQLALSYDSGAGNGPFGFGWHLSVPAITRKTPKGLPRYRDADDSDVFLLSDAEDLVPALGADGERISDPKLLHGVWYTVEPYRPRIEGLFARIERWTRSVDGDVHWRATTRDNITSVYGASANSRVADGSRVFSWLLERSYDDKGNVIVYGYAAEDQANVPATVSERHRAVTANRYLKRMSYGHQTPYHPDATAAQPTPLPADWCFQLVFDYGEHDPAVPRVDDDATSHWPSRPDAFSSYRAGFEIRTYRRCRRALMFHRFAELGPEPVLVRSTDFSYIQGEPNGYSLLASVTQTGYLRNPDDGGYSVTSPATGETLSPKALPPVEFTYSSAAVDQTVHAVDPASLEQLPIGLDGAQYQWVNLDGEGLPGILTEQAEAWFYKRRRAKRRRTTSRATCPDGPPGGGHCYVFNIIAVVHAHTPLLITTNAGPADFAAHTLRLPANFSWRVARQLTSERGCVTRRKRTDAQSRRTEMVCSNHRSEEKRCLGRS